MRRKFYVFISLMVVLMLAACSSADLIDSIDIENLKDNVRND